MIEEWAGVPKITEAERTVGAEVELETSRRWTLGFDGDAADAVSKRVGRDS